MLLYSKVQSLAGQPLTTLLALHATLPSAPPDMVQTHPPPPKCAPLPHPGDDRPALRRVGLEVLAVPLVVLPAAGPQVAEREQRKRQPGQRPGGDCVARPLDDLACSTVTAAGQGGGVRIARWGRLHVGVGFESWRGGRWRGAGGVRRMGGVGVASRCSVERAGVKLAADTTRNAEQPVKLAADTRRNRPPWGIL